MYFYISIVMPSKFLAFLKKVTSSQMAEIYLGKNGLKENETINSAVITTKAMTQDRRMGAEMHYRTTQE